MPSGAKTKRTTFFSVKKRERVKVCSSKKLECSSLPLFLLVCRTPSTQEGSKWIDRVVNKCRVANFVSGYTPRHFDRHCFGSSIGRRSLMRSGRRSCENWRYASTTIARMRGSQSPSVFYRRLHISWISTYSVGLYCCYCGLLLPRRPLLCGYGKDCISALLAVRALRKESD